ncbi:MAG TPA: sigma-70 family RNA polymerase sigma factor [Streptosporangiaceae bacterium]|nr:sigma-70 family RNA polymerase sigma factor [Streptosporangiaceae bacterium]
MPNFELNQDLMFGVAYRVLGSVADAEDVVQESWLRWNRVDTSQVGDPRSYLVQTSTRLALDRLRRAKASREEAAGECAELCESVSMAMLAVLETLSPLERVTFVLREAFEFSFAEIADITGRSEPSVRQVFRRARLHARERRPRFRDDPNVRKGVTERLIAACLDSDLDALLGLLAPGVMLWRDANGRRGLPRNPVQGAHKVSRMLVNGARNFTGSAGPGQSMVHVNGGPAALLTVAGELVGVVVLDVDEATGRVTQIWLIANRFPQK